MTAETSKCKLIFNATAKTGGMIRFLDISLKLWHWLGYVYQMIIITGTKEAYVRTWVRIINF
jgi:hypothetical protein